VGASPQVQLTTRVILMANSEHLKILKQGAMAWNRWRRENPLEIPDLSGADLDGTVFIEMSQGRTASFNLIKANLSGVSLIGANFANTELIQANLEGALLIRANFSVRSVGFPGGARSVSIGSEMAGANLSRADLSYSDFGYAEVENVIFSNATMAGTKFGDNDLSTVIGLDSVKHEAPSSIGIDTIYRSKGNIPEAFLRGCGLSDWQIESAKLYNPDLSNEEINNIQYKIHDLRVCQAIQIGPLFISYSHSDSDFVDAIEKCLIGQGIRFWRDIHHATSGRLERVIDRALSLHDVVLVVLSKDSTGSDWVEHEVRKAREKERKTGKDALCPVALDDSWKTCRWPERLREQIMEYNILDFSSWQDANDFQKMFGKLLAGLNLFYK
jgi:uncharacterized protein YjbI with pentapeptide repeats